MYSLSRIFAFELVKIFSVIPSDCYPVAVAADHYHTKTVILLLKVKLPSADHKEKISLFQIPHRSFIDESSIALTQHNCAKH